MELSAHEVRELIVDEGSYGAVPDGSAASPPGSGVAIGRATIGGKPVVTIISDFRHVAGTMTADDAYLIAKGFDVARNEQRAVVGVANSGGVRLQQGTRPFSSMMAIAAAVARHKHAGLLYYCYLAHPTTGGVLASWAGLAHVTAAEPNALIAFTGPRVTELTTGENVPLTACRAESLRTHGLLDDIYLPGAIRAHVIPLLRATSGKDSRLSGCAPLAKAGRYISASAKGRAWHSVEMTRSPHRPGGRDFVAQLIDSTLLHGDGQGDGDDPAIIAAIGRLGTTGVVVVAHDRTARFAGPVEGSPQVTVAGMRKARRALALAEQLRLPLISVIDTAGAQLCVTTEVDGMAFEIARMLEERSQARTGLVSVLLGQGGGGVALALLPADRILAAENAWLAPLPPEGASAVLKRSIDGAPQIAEAQHITSADLYRLCVVDEIVAEDGAWISDLIGRVAHAAASVQGLSAGRRVEQRARRLRAVARAARTEVRAERY